jgi:hypothetical protein
MTLECRVCAPWGMSNDPDYFYLCGECGGSGDVSYRRDTAMALDRAQRTAEWLRCRAADTSQAYGQGLVSEAVSIELLLSIVLGNAVLRSRREGRRGAPAPTHAQLRALDDVWLAGFGIVRLVDSDPLVRVTEET